MRDQPIEIFPNVTIVTFVSSLYNYLPLLTMGWLNSKKKKKEMASSIWLITFRTLNLIAVAVLGEWPGPPLF